MYMHRQTHTPTAATTMTTLCVHTKPSSSADKACKYEGIEVLWERSGTFNKKIFDRGSCARGSIKILQKTHLRLVQLMKSKLCPRKSWHATPRPNLKNSCLALRVGSIDVILALPPKYLSVGVLIYPFQSEHNTASQPCSRLCWHWIQVFTLGLETNIHTV